MIEPLPINYSIFDSMKKTFLALSMILTATVSPAATFVGNGESGFGGVLGTGSISVTDDGSNLNFTFTKGSGSFSDFLVLYFDAPSTPSGATILDTSGEAGDNFSGRRAIANEYGSGISAMPSSFTASHAFALRTNGSESNHLFSIASNSDNMNTLGFVNTYSVSNFGSTTASSYSWSIPFSALGLTQSVSATDTIKFFATYLNPLDGGNATYRSNEALSGEAMGGSNIGYNDYSFGTSFSYTVTPEPSRALFAGLGLAAICLRRRRK